MIAIIPEDSLILLGSMPTNIKKRPHIQEVLMRTITMDG